MNFWWPRNDHHNFLGAPGQPPRTFCFLAVVALNFRRPYNNWHKLLETSRWSPGPAETNKAVATRRQQPFSSFLFFSSSILRKHSSIFYFSKTLLKFLPNEFSCVNSIYNTFYKCGTTKSVLNFDLFQTQKVKAFFKTLPNGSISNANQNNHI
jgi:hypothetical protein